MTISGDVPLGLLASVAAPGGSPGPAPTSWVKAIPLRYEYDSAVWAVFDVPHRPAQTHSVTGRTITGPVRRLRRTVVGVKALLRGGPGDGRVVDVARPEVVWGACLYERTHAMARVQGHEARVYEHRSDCCESYAGRGDTDGCE